jgi:hypothetical protein
MVLCGVIVCRATMAICIVVFGHTIMAIGSIVIGLTPATEVCGVVVCRTTWAIGIFGGQLSDVADQMAMAESSHVAEQMAEPGDIARASHMAEQMAEPGDVARALLKIVGGKPLSPGVYRALQLLRNPVKEAWKQAFVRTLTFN